MLSVQVFPVPAFSQSNNHTLRVPGMCDWHALQPSLGIYGMNEN